ncbi:MAG: hypothetical protein FWD17_06645, partial [Polyangiaceae bacterium]|nr:hypothetical protein [Polyangiaceae bacterium]
MQSFFSRLGLSGVLGAAILVGCFTDESLVICAGQKGCDCQPDQTCNAGLTCQGGHCVGSGATSSGPGNPTPPPPSIDDAAAPADDGATASSPDAPPPASGDDDASSSMSDAASAPPATGADSATTGGSSGNLVTNGDFSQGMALWGIVAGTGTITVTG